MQPSFKTARKTMTKRALILLGTFGFVIAVAAGPPTTVLADEVQSLRGGAGIPEALPAPDLNKQLTKQERFTRNFRQQPPLTPHKTDKYQIDRKVNQCLNCHDWPNNVKENATKVSETHYTDRNGKKLEHVARTRWFCNQCHVPQKDAKELVENTFKPLKRKQ